MASFYLFSSNAITGSGSSQNLASIENPVGSTNNVIIDHVELQSFTSVLSFTVFKINIGRTTAVPTGGSVQTAQKRHTSDSSPIGIVRTLPTATMDTGKLWTGFPGILATVVGAIVPFSDVTALKDMHIQLLAGEAILISADANSTNHNHIVRIYWYESPT